MRLTKASLGWLFLCTLSISLCSNVYQVAGREKHGSVPRNLYSSYSWSPVDYPGDPASNYHHASGPPVNTAERHNRRLDEPANAAAGEKNAAGEEAPVAVELAPAPPMRRADAPERRLEDNVYEAAYQNIRIKFDTSTIDVNLQNNQQLLSYIKNDVVPAAVAWLQSALRTKRVQGSLKLTPTCTNGFPQLDGTYKCSKVTRACGSAMIPESHFGSYTLWDWENGWVTTDVPGGEGVGPYDYVIYLSADQSRCDADTLAFAGMCYRDQNDKPIAGHFNFCLAAFNSSPGWHDDVATAVHEMLHGLGFDYESVSYFRNQDGTPKTKRDNNGRVSKVNIYDSTNQMVDVPNPDPSVMTIDQDGVTKRYKFTVKTPWVVAIARQQSGCSSLTGVSFEDQGGPGTEWTHWEKRTTGPEAMTSDATGFSVQQFSAYTLALMHDSGCFDDVYL